MSFITAISPYHLATREAPAMAALVLGERSVTLMPHPAAGTAKAQVAQAVRRAPRYLRLMESWRWTTPLWRAGVLSSRIHGEEAAGDIPGIYGDIRNEGALTDLRPLTRNADALSDERPDAFLDAMCGDVLRGGPDPGFNIPLNAALERFSQRHGLVVARGAASSVAQRAESRLGSRVFSIGVPMLVQAGGARLLLAREDLRRPLGALRRAMERSFDEGRVAGALASAAAGYAEAFNSWSASGAGRGDDETGNRLVTAFISVTGMLMPADAVLRSSRAAVRSVGGYAMAARGRGSAGDEPVEPPAMVQRTLIIREMNASPI